MHLQSALNYQTVRFMFGMCASAHWLSSFPHNHMAARAAVKHGLQKWGRGLEPNLAHRTLTPLMGCNFLMFTDQQLLSGGE